jgi:type 1 glutamine amidotransferase
MTIRYGKGRVFHTVLGHSVESMQCVGFLITFQRGVQWAATGKVSIQVPADFPTATEVRTRR